MKNNKLKEIRVLVVNVHAYGNVGDHLETAPLFVKLKELGVGTIHAHIAEYSQKMGNSYNIKIPAIGGINYFDKYADKILYTIPKKPNYDFIIHAPGPCIDAGADRDTLFSSEYLEKCKFIYFGMTFTTWDICWLQTQIVNQNRYISGIFVREPKSFIEINNLVNNINKQIPNLKTPNILMSKDISFSSEISTDMQAANEHYINFKKKYGEGYDLVILRASSSEPYKYSETGPGLVTRNTNSKLVVVTKNKKIEKKYLLKPNTIIATTDYVTDELLMKKSKESLPNIPHIMCKTVGELHGLVRGASRVFSNRYHGGVMSVHQNKHLIVLDHWETSKMEGVKMLSVGKSNGTYTEDNDEAWELLNSILQNNS